MNPIKQIAKLTISEATHCRTSKTDFKYKAVNYSVEYIACTKPLFFIEKKDLAIRSTAAIYVNYGNGMLGKMVYNEMYESEILNSQMKAGTKQVLKHPNLYIPTKNGKVDS